MRWTLIWAVKVSSLIFLGGDCSAQRIDSRRVAHDRLLSKIDDANAKVDALYAELAALKKQGEQDPENLKRALANINSLEQLFGVAQKYPLWRMGKNDLYYSFQTKFYALNKETLSNLKTDSAEHRQALKQYEARYNQLLSNANVATREYFNRAESILAKLRIHQDYSGKLIDLGKERMKAEQEMAARLSQRELGMQERGNRDREARRRGGEFLGWDAAGNPIVSIPSGDDQVIRNDRGGYTPLIPVDGGYIHRNEEGNFDFKPVNQ
jgi:hypothetical protein